MLHRFGPLNTEGGERRLNVAITRARRSMTVVSSIAAGDLDPARLKARGAVMLRDFLAYAATGSLPGATAPTSDAGASGSSADSPGALGGFGVARGRWCWPARQLRRHGLVVHEGVGLSRPGRPCRRGPAPARPPVLAVEARTAMHAAMRTTRDRDRLRAEQLERLGWRHLAGGPPMF